MEAPTPAQRAALLRHYRRGDLDALAKRLGTNRGQLHAWAVQLGLNPRGRHKWTAENDQYLREHYPTGVGPEIAKHLGVNVKAMYHRARRLGLAKVPDFLSKLAKSTGLPERGRPHRFAPGSTPANKGKKMPLEVYAKLKHTMFPKGRMPHNWVPVGTQSRSKEGYLKMKVADDRDRPSRFNWKFLHVMLWEQHHGPVPPRHVVCFRDGNKDNITIDNLELISMRDNMSRNSVANMEPELRNTYRAMAQLTITINKHAERE